MSLESYYRKELEKERDRVKKLRDALREIKKESDGEHIAEIPDKDFHIETHLDHCYLVAEQALTDTEDKAK